MTRWLFLLHLSLALVSGCGGYTMTYGVASKSGHVNYPLCEKAKQRITDIQRISFELPPLFKQAPCQNWPDYGYNAKTDRVSVGIPGVIANESQMSIGGVYSMSFHAGPGRKEYYLSPEVFFVDYQEYLSKRSATSRLVTASWVEWSAGRCARFYSDNDTKLYLLRVADYFCWEPASGSDFPIHIAASEKLPPGRTPTNLDKELIEPVLSSLQINPVPPERLAQWAGYRTEFCAALKKSYDEKSAVKLADDPDRRRSVRYLRECGYEMPDAVGVEDWRDIFKPQGELIGEQLGQASLRKVSRAQFSAIEKKLFELAPKSGVRPDIRALKLSRDGNVLVKKFIVTGPYDGQWYHVPPYYSEREGFGIRHDSELGRTLDVSIRESGLPLYLRIVAED